MHNIPSPQELNTLIQDLSTTVTHPEFLKALEEVNSLPAVQRSRAISTQLTPQALAARGVPIPQGMRITTRYFENPDYRTISAANVGTTEPNGPSEPGPEPPKVCIWVGEILICTDLFSPPDEMS